MTTNNDLHHDPSDVSTTTTMTTKRIQEHPILQRHYSTIGIGNVFVVMMNHPPPPHHHNTNNITTTTTTTTTEENASQLRHHPPSSPLPQQWLFPSDYLSISTTNTPKTTTQLGKDGSETTTTTSSASTKNNHHPIDSSSSSCRRCIVMGHEMIGRIKRQPEDFIVQEIALVQGQIRNANIDMDYDHHNIIRNTTTTIGSSRTPSVSYPIQNTNVNVVNVGNDKIEDQLPQHQQHDNDNNHNVGSDHPTTTATKNHSNVLHDDIVPPLPVSSTTTTSTTTRSTPCDIPSQSPPLSPPPPFRSNHITSTTQMRHHSSSLEIEPERNEVDPIQHLDLLFQNHLHSFTVTKENIHTTVSTSTSTSSPSSETLRTILQDMETKALQRIQSIHDQYKYCDTDTSSSSSPPPTDLSSSYPTNDMMAVEVTLSYPKNIHDTNIELQQYKQHKTNFHEWFRQVYPLLIAESCKMTSTTTTTTAQHNEVELQHDKNHSRLHHDSSNNHSDYYYYYTIQIRMDTTFDGLIPYLYVPVEDLLVLYRYANMVTMTATQRNQVRHVIWVVICHDRILRYVLLPPPPPHHHHYYVYLPNVPRLYRRPIHQFIDQTSKSLLGTETVSDYPISNEVHVVSKDDSEKIISSTNSLPDTSSSAPSAALPPTTTTTTAIRIFWTKMAARKASKKRQRAVVTSNRGDDGIPSKVQRPKTGMSKVLCIVKKRQREHLGMVNTISAVLKCSPSDIGLAGMKDLQAITYQFGTLNDHIVQRYQQNPSLRNTLSQRGIEIMPLHPVPEPLNKGDLIGNYFQITVRDMRRVQLEYNNSASNVIQETFIPVDDPYLHQMMERVRINGFINFYGEQRVGDPGHISLVGVRAFDIGRAMLQQNYAKAIDLLITGRRMINGIDLVETNDVEPFRRIWKETNGDAIATAKALPSGSHSVPRERAVLKGLVRYGNDQPLTAFRCLPRNERLFFINAYQSYVWNMMATERMQLYGNQVVAGDLILVEKDGNKPIHVTQSDLSDESRRDIYHMSNVVLPMPGYDTIYPNNTIGVLYKEFLEKENVVFDKNAAHDEAKARGSYRRVIAHVDQFTYEHIPSDESSMVDVLLKFHLPKGSYATMLLRELMLKTVARDDPDMYHNIPDPDE